jgi:hypothetical protein
MSVLGNLVIKFNKQDFNEIEQKDDSSLRSSYQKHKIEDYSSNTNLSRALSGCSAKLKNVFEDLYQVFRVSFSLALLFLKNYLL